MKISLCDIGSIVGNSAHISGRMGIYEVSTLFCVLSDRLSLKESVAAMKKNPLALFIDNWHLTLFAALILSMLILSSWSYQSAKEELDRKSQIILQHATETALERIRDKQEDLRNSTMTLEEMQEQVKVELMGPKNPDGTRTVLEHFGLGEKGYLVIYDLQGLEVMHPTLEGQNVFMVKDYSQNPKYLVQELLNAAKNGGGFTRYVWYYPDTKEKAMKLAYSRLEPEWGWVISSTAYEEDFSSGSIAIMRAMTFLLCGMLLISIIFITMYRKYEQDMRNNIFNTLPHGFVFLDGTMQILHASTAAAAILECRQEDIIGQSLDSVLASLYDLKGNLIPNDERPAATALETNQVVQDFIVQTYVNGASTRKWLKINAIPLRTGFMHVKKQVYAHFEDITAQMEREQENRKLVLGLAVAPVSVIITDADARITYVNRAFELASGYTMDEVLGKNPKILQYDSGKNTDYSKLWATLSAGEIWRGEFVNRRKNGSKYYESSVIAPLKDEAGRITHYVAVKEDTTRLHIANKRLNLTLKNLEELVEMRTRDAVQAKDMTIDSMAILSEYRDNETGAHIHRTKHYVRLLLEAVKDKAHYNAYDIEQYWKSAPLHDIGKVAIPDSILLKPGKLTPEEYEIMKNHVQYGYEALLRTESQMDKPGYMKYAMEILLGHHEKWDGSGYPRGLKGSQIPVSARVMAIADVYDALTSRRPYKEPFSHKKAMSIILEGAGTHFDPMLVKVFIENQDAIQAISEKYKE